MKLRFLREAKVSDIDLVMAVKDSDDKYAALRDSTIAEIINLYKKDTEDQEPTAQKVIEWLGDFDSLADFVFSNSNDITTFSTSDFAEHDEKLGAAIRKVLRDWKVIDENDVDLTGTGKKLSMHNMCSILFDNMAETAKVPHSERKEKIPQWVYQMYNLLSKDVNPDETELAAAKAEIEAKYAAMTDEEKKEYEHYVELLKEYNAKTKDPAITKKSFEAIENAYNQLYEGLDSETCPKCGKCPCVCEAVEAEEEEAPEDVKVEAEVDVPEEPVEPPVEVTEPVDAEAVAKPSMLTAAFHGLLSNLVQTHWHLIDDLNAAITMLDSEEFASLDTKGDIAKILTGVIDDCTIDVGMLYKAMEIVSNKTSDLIANGMARAEETID